LIRRSPRSRSSIRPIASPPDRPAISARLDQLAGSGRGQNNFDLLRLIAATAVVFGHSFDLLKVGEPFPSLLGLSWGTFGVLIFFSISGFLVARSWDKEPRLGAFAAKRA